MHTHTHIYMYKESNSNMRQTIHAFNYCYHPNKDNNTNKQKTTDQKGTTYQLDIQTQLTIVASWNHKTPKPNEKEPTKRMQKTE